MTHILGSSLDDAQEIAIPKIRTSKLRMDVGKIFSTRGAASVSVFEQVHRHPFQSIIYKN